MLGHVLEIVETGKIHEIIPPKDDEMNMPMVVGFDQLSDYFYHWYHDQYGHDPDFWAEVYTNDLQNLWGYNELKNYDELDDCYYIRRTKK